jgi:seryl-tRNA(Sec) selenium transferase
MACSATQRATSRLGGTCARAEAAAGVGNDDAFVEWAAMRAGMRRLVVDMHMVEEVERFRFARALAALHCRFIFA